MTAHVQYRTHLTCDRDGCKSRFPVSGYIPQHWKYVRTAAAEECWTTDALGRDVCGMAHGPLENET